MRKIKVMIIGMLLGVLFISCLTAKEDAKMIKKIGTGEVSLCYIGSSGFLIETKNKKIMIDGAFDNYVQKFEVEIPTDQTREKIARGEAPYDAIDLFLVTHSHKGHFDPELLALGIMNNPGAQVVTNKAVYNELQEKIPLFNSFRDRVFFPGLKIGESLTKSIKGVEIGMTKTDHWGGLTQLNFEFLVDGLNIVYALEPADFVNKKAVDIQFVSSLESTVNPGFMILTHQSGNEKKLIKLEETKKIKDAYFPMASTEVITLARDGEKIIIR